MAADIGKTGSYAADGSGRTQLVVPPRPLPTCEGVDGGEVAAESVTLAQQTARCISPQFLSPGPHPVTPRFQRPRTHFELTVLPAVCTGYGAGLCLAAAPPSFDIVTEVATSTRRSQASLPGGWVPRRARPAK
jgi:hypothetical protein